MAGASLLIRVGCASFLLSTAPAAACSIMPPPPRSIGETDAGYAGRLMELDRANVHEQQRSEWQKAVAVVVVELRPSSSRSPDRSKWVRVVRWIKGDPQPIDFKFRPIGWCFGEGVIAEGKPTEKFALLFADKKIKRDAIVGAWRTDLISFAPLREAVAAALSP